MACSLGPHALMAKMDVKNACRKVPVHSEDQHLLPVRWKGEVLIDGTLPFRLRSPPKLLQRWADALVRIFWCKDVNKAIHYLDDFIPFLGPPGSEE